MTDIDTDRLRQLANCAADGAWSEFRMSIPARQDHDADLVLMAAADEIDRLRVEIELVRSAVGGAGYLGGPSIEYCVRAMADELHRLRAWKSEAMTVLGAWDQVHAALGSPGRLGELKAEASLTEVTRLRAEVAALQDPAKVLVNMMRGTIATPSPASLASLFGANLTDLEAANLRIAELSHALRKIAEGNLGDCSPH